MDIEKIHLDTLIDGKLTILRTPSSTTLEHILVGQPSSGILYKIGKSDFITDMNLVTNDLLLTSISLANEITLNVSQNILTIPYATNTEPGIVKLGYTNNGVNIGVVNSADKRLFIALTQGAVMDAIGALWNTKYDIPNGNANQYIDGTGSLQTFPSTSTFPVTSINEMTGDVIITKSDIDLGNVDNTSDINKPISTATQSALDTKQTIITGAATTIVSDNLTIDKVVVSDANGKVTTSNVSTTDLMAVVGSGSHTNAGYLKSDDIKNLSIYNNQTKLMDYNPLVSSSVTFVGDNGIIITSSNSNTLTIGLDSQTNIGTITSIGLTMPNGFNIDNSPLTQNGFINVTFASGYSIPTIANQSNWDLAFGWGNHASAGYLTSTSLATSTTPGLVELFSDTVQTVDANAVTAIASRTYGVQINSAGQMVVNVPWIDSGSGSGSTYTPGSGLTLTGTTFSVSYGTVAGTAAQGNDSRIVNGQTAFGWGNHASVGYLTSVPLATSTVAGRVLLFSDTVQTVDANAVTAIASRTYGVQINNVGQMVVNVPWVDTSTTYTAGSGLTLTGTTFSVSYGTVAGTAAQGNDSRIINGETAFGWGNHASAGYLTSVPTATSTVAGSVELFSDTIQTAAANAVSATASRTYGVQLNSAGQMVVNVPWVESGSGTDPVIGTSYTAGTGLILTDTSFSVDYGTVAGTAAQGNDSRIVNGQTAFGWGNHASVGYLTSVPLATSTVAGRVELFSDTVQTVAASVVSTTASRTYGIQLNSAGQMVVNVPWVDTNINTTYTAGTGLTLAGTAFSVNYGTTAGTAAQGNDSRIVNGQTAYGWGNHASVGYALSSHTHTFDSITSKPTTLAGYGIIDADISGVVSNSATGTTDLASTTNGNTYINRLQGGVIKESVRLIGAGGTTITHAVGGVITITSTNTTYTAGTGLTLTGTAFSVDYGTTAGTAAQGNDSRINNGQTAFVWGNHASAGYLTSVPLATSTTPGIVELFSDTIQTVAANAVTTTASRTYGVQLNSAGQMVVNVPWVDTSSGATYTAGTGLTLTGTAFSVNYGTTAGTAAQGNDSRINNGQTAFGWGNHASAGYLTSVPLATSTVAGRVELFSDTVQTVAANAVTTTSSRTYGVQLNSAGQMVVNVPWVDTNSNTTYTAGTGLTLTGTAFSVDYGTTAGTAAQGNDSRINNGQTAFGWGNHASAGYATQTWVQNQGYLTSYTDTNTTYTAGTGLTLTGTVFSLPITTSGSGNVVTNIVASTNGITVTKGTVTDTITRLRGGANSYLTGDISIIAGTGISVTQSGSNITITSTQSSGSTYTQGTLNNLQSGTLTTPMVWSPQTINQYINNQSFDSIFAYSSAGGLFTTNWASSASAEYALSIGHSTNASAPSASAIGSAVYTSGYGSSNHGFSSTVTGSLSINMGANNINRSSSSATIGLGLSNQQDGLTLIGRYNASTTSLPMGTTTPSQLPVIAFGIGTGASNSERKNGPTIFGDGRMDYAVGYDPNTWTDRTLITKGWAQANLGGGGSGGGFTMYVNGSNALTSSVNLIAGNNVTFSLNGNNLTINSGGGSGGGSGTQNFINISNPNVTNTNGTSFNGLVSQPTLIQSMLMEDEYNSKISVCVSHSFSNSPYYVKPDSRNWYHHWGVVDEQNSIIVHEGSVSINSSVFDDLINAEKTILIVTHDYGGGGNIRIRFVSNDELRDFRQIDIKDNKHEGVILGSLLYGTDNSTLLKVKIQHL